MADSGVRSSCEASAANRRSRASLASRRPRARSTWYSIRLNAAPTRPTSVLGSLSGTPAGSVTSPESSGSSATRAAVTATRRSGRSDNRTSTVPSTPASTSTHRKTISSAAATWPSVCSTVLSGRPVTRTSPSCPATKVTR
jgi:hypothetical protein